MEGGGCQEMPHPTIVCYQQPSNPRYFQHPMLTQTQSHRRLVLDNEVHSFGPTSASVTTTPPPQPI